MNYYEEQCLTELVIVGFIFYFKAAVSAARLPCCPAYSLYSCHCLLNFGTSSVK